MIVCPRCTKENQDHYKFCLGCGSELPRDASAPKSFSAPTPPSAMPAVTPDAEAPKQDRSLQFAATQQGDPSLVAEVTEGAAAAAAAAAAAPAAEAPAPSAPAPAISAPPAAASMAPNNCPSCGNPVPHDFKFCGTCGHRMDEAPEVAASQPAPAAAASEASAPQASAAPARGSLVLINPDGTEGESFSLTDGSTTVGREAGGVFTSDSYMSPRHATFTFDGDSCQVRDEGSLNGVYVKIERDQPVRLNDGDVFRVGQEIVRYEAIAATGDVQGVEPMGSPNPGYHGRILLVTGREATGNSHPIPPDGMHIGRERGDVIFPEDGYVSGLHCRLHHDGTSVVLTDVGSSNGTFRRIGAEAPVASGQLVLMGQQLFRLQY